MTLRTLVFLCALGACGRWGFDNAAPATDGMFDPSITHRVSITRSGAGTGSVTSPAGLDCGTTCDLDLPEGTEVTLTAAPDDASWFEGWPEGPCRGRDRTCTFTVAADTAVTSDFTPQPNRIFVSSMTHDGLFSGGTVGADAFCMQQATAAGLQGTFIALLSTTTTHWTARVGNAAGWIRRDDQPVAASAADLSSRLWFVPRLDENGNDTIDVPIWAATQTNTCSDWTTNGAAKSGRQMSTTRGWNLNSGGGDAPCNSAAHVWCAQIDHQVAIAPVPPADRLAFTSTAGFDPSTGLAGADALCSSEATAAGRTGTFKALLATSTASALSRFADGPGWSRPDGMPLLPSRAAWDAATTLDVAPVLTADGSDLLFSFIFNGFAGAPNQPGTLASTCNDWTSTTIGAPICMATWETGFSGCTRSSSCSSTFHILCLQD